MISCEDLKDLYDTANFKEAADSFSIMEAAPEATLTRVDFFLPGCNFEYCPDSFWEKSAGLFVKKSGSISYKQHCDGFAMFSYSGRNYLVWIELKSSFSESVTKGIFQIATSSVKTNSIIRNLRGYIREGYEAFGIIISRSENYRDNSISANENVVGRRQMIATPQEQILGQWRKGFLQDGIIVLNQDDIDKECSHLVPEILLNDFPVIWYKSDESEVLVDLMSIISQYHSCKQSRLDNLDHIL